MKKHKHCGHLLKIAKYSVSNASNITKIHQLSTGQLVKRIHLSRTIFSCHGQADSRQFRALYITSMR